MRLYKSFTTCLPPQYLHVYNLCDKTVIGNSSDSTCNPSLASGGGDLLAAGKQADRGLPQLRPYHPGPDPWQGPQAGEDRQSVRIA